MNQKTAWKTRTMDLLCLGEPMVEFNQAPGGHFIQGFGGDSSNCAISAARQGARVGYLTRIGADRFGDALIELWQSEKLDVSGVIRDPRAPTGIYFVTHDDDGHHFAYYRAHSAAARMAPADLSAQRIASAKILHVTAISQAISESAAQTVNAAIELAREHDTLVSYDTNLRLNLWPLEKAREVIHAAMRHCQIALPSYDDARLLSGEEKADSIIDFYLALGAEMVLLKLGKDGSIAATRDSRTAVPGIDVDSIDANAAGDSFAGAFLAEYCRTLDLLSAARYANLAAAISTERSGAISSIPRREEVLKRLAD